MWNITPSTVLLSIPFPDYLSMMPICSLPQADASSVITLFIVPRLAPNVVVASGSASV
jgi:hypothetical protein